MLIDNTAVSIVDNINYDFSEMAKKINPLIRAAWIARSLFFDNEIKDFLKKYPDKSVINIGCGLDTTFDRVDNGKAVWYELDFADVINLRRKYIKETSRRIFVSCSVFDEKWYQEIKNRKNVFIMIAGVIYYFEEQEIKNMFNTFSNEFENCDIVFDYSSPKGVKISNKKVIEDGGMDKNAFLKWGIEDIKQIEKWNSKIKVIKNMPMYKNYKKNFPIMKRIGMNISDAIKVMSIAHITIE